MVRQTIAYKDLIGTHDSEPLLVSLCTYAIPARKTKTCPTTAKITNLKRFGFLSLFDPPISLQSKNIKSRLWIENTEMKIRF